MVAPGVPYAKQCAGSQSIEYDKPEVVGDVVNVVVVVVVVISGRSVDLQRTTAAFPADDAAKHSVVARWSVGI